MAEQTETVETQQATETEAVESAPQDASTETGGTLEERIARMEAALKKANAEAAKFRKRAESFEQAEQERKRAEMTETDRLKADLAAKDAELKRMTLDNTKRAIAAEVGLPDVLALRIQGDDEDAMRADAKALLEALPKGETVTKKVTQVANPGSGQPVTESPDARRARIYGGGGGSIFDPSTAAKHGGGVIFTRKE